MHRYARNDGISRYLSREQNKPRLGAHTQNMMSQPNYGPLNSLLIEEQFHRSFHAYGVLQ